MPYIHQHRRNQVDELIDHLVNRLRVMEPVRGDVNYVVTRIVLEVLNCDSYHSLSDCVSVLRDAADEIARRLLGPYENEAILKNGDMEAYAKDYANREPPRRPDDPDGPRRVYPWQ